jgi:hypothetical protein
MELDSVRVEGKTQPVKTCDLAGYRGIPADPNLCTDQVSIESCLDLRKNPPPADSDGLCEITAK